MIFLRALSIIPLYYGTHASVYIGGVLRSEPTRRERECRVSPPLVRRSRGQHCGPTGNIAAAPSLACGGVAPQVAMVCVASAGRVGGGARGGGGAASTPRRSGLASARDRGSSTAGGGATPRAPMERPGKLRQRCPDSQRRR
ncbi:hypothetical protein SEVIR_7G304966v4 [Setaria viridis]